MDEDTSAKRISAALEHLSSSLDQVKETADNIHAEEQKAKKPRIEDGALGSGALQPFALPGGKQP